MVVTQCIHNDVGTGATIEHIAYNVKRIYGELLNEIAHGYDEIVCPFCGYDGAYDDVDISVFVGVYGRFMQQLLDDV
jgi:hypothetical protein